LETASIGIEIQAALLIGVTAILLGKAEIFMFSESTKNDAMMRQQWGTQCPWLVQNGLTVVVVSGHLIGRLFQHGQTNHI